MLFNVNQSLNINRYNNLIEHPSAKFVFSNQTEYVPLAMLPMHSKEASASFMNIHLKGFRHYGFRKWVFRNIFCHGYGMVHSDTCYHLLKRNNVFVTVGPHFIIDEKSERICCISVVHSSNLQQIYDEWISHKPCSTHLIEFWYDIDFDKPASYAIPVRRMYREAILWSFIKEGIRVLGKSQAEMNECLYKFPLPSRLKSIEEMDTFFDVLADVTVAGEQANHE